MVRALEICLHSSVREVLSYHRALDLFVTTLDMTAFCCCVWCSTNNTTCTGTTVPCALDAYRAKLSAGLMNLGFEVRVCVRVCVRACGLQGTHSRNQPKTPILEIRYLNRFWTPTKMFWMFNTRVQPRSGLGVSVNTAMQSITQLWSF